MAPATPSQGTTPSAPGRPSVPPDAADAAAASPNGNVTRRPLPVLIRSIMQTLEKDPGLTEDQLAQALDLDREDVALATGELLDRGWVTLAPDGGYRQADGSTNDEQGGGHHAMTTASDACRVCGRDLRGTRPGGLCGFCDPNGAADEQ